jgi:hypothetical protein
MSRNARYWKLTRLDLTGHRKATELSEAKAFFQGLWGEDDDLSPIEIQSKLLEISDREPLADLCLRCFISNQIEQVCIQLEQQFGLNHGFSRQDLFPLVLDDDGKLNANSQYLSVARNILNTFEPSKGSLSTWTIRLVKHNRDLNQFLMESGVCLLSDWAILNDTNASKLRRIMAEFLSISAYETEQAIFLLDAYHAVYRADRLAQRQTGVRGACPTPTEDQLQRIQQELGEGTPRSILAKLQQLASQLRQYRVASRAGRLPTVSIESGENVTIGDRLAAPTDHEDDGANEQNAFLQAFRGQFGPALDRAFNHVIQARTSRYKAAKSQSFLAALKLFHCQGRSMTEIAAQVGLQAQFQVSRLLNLKAFREDVRHQMVQQLLVFVNQQAVKQQAAELMSPDRLQQLDAQIEAALNEQIEGIMQEAAAQAQSPKDYVTGTMFSRTLCGQLDRA